MIGAAGTRMSLRSVGLMAGREIRSSTQKRSFWVGMASTLVIVLAIAVLPGVLGGDSSSSYDVAVVAGDDGISAPLAAVDAATDQVDVELTVVADADAARDAVLDETVDAAVVGDVVLTRDGIGNDLMAVLDDAARLLLIDDQRTSGTLSPEAAERLAAPHLLTVESLEPADDDALAREALVVIGVFIVFAQIFTFGFAVASGIVEEKSSRVVEVLLAKLRPGELLAGKLLGIFTIATAQTLVIGAIGLAAADASGTMSLPPGWPGVIGVILGWYLVAYVFFACLFAIGGALAASAEELQSTITPATLLVFLAYAAGFVVLNDPDGPLATAASLFPATAALAMPLRTVMGDPALWEIAAAVALTLTAAALLVPVASRIYRGSALRTRQTKLVTAWRDARA